MIEIQDIKNHSVEDIIDLLLDEKVQPFKIYVPKSTVLFSSTNEDIANDYAMLAYAGQKLSDSSDNLDYEYISPNIHSSVCFTISTKNIEKLATAIYEVSLGYNNEAEEEVIYLDEAYQFIDDVENLKVVPACKEFIEDYNMYNELSQENPEDI